MYENAATAGQQVTPFPLWRGVLETLRHWASLLTTCEHRNLSNHGPYNQRCWDCKRVRAVGVNGHTGFWHREAL